SVHIKGRMRFLGDDELGEILRLTSLHFEEGNENSPTVFDNLPTAFKERVMGAIVGFEIDVQEMEAVFKLSQDRDAESYKNIMAKLRQQDESGSAIADEMAKRAKDLFPNFEM
ncbi:MAG: FMN-binding negative transcriptional regulator, partial [Cryomorphaceae bacterium]